MIRQTILQPTTSQAYSEEFTAPDGQDATIRVVGLQGNETAILENYDITSNTWTSTGTSIPNGVPVFVWRTSSLYRVNKSATLNAVGVSLDQIQVGL